MELQVQGLLRGHEVFLQNVQPFLMIPRGFRIKTVIEMRRNSVGDRSRVIDEFTEGMTGYYTAKYLWIFTKKRLRGVMVTVVSVFPRVDLVTRKIHGV